MMYMFCLTSIIESSLLFCVAFFSSGDGYASGGKNRGPCDSVHGANVNTYRYFQGRRVNAQSPKSG